MFLYVILFRLVAIVHEKSAGRSVSEVAEYLQSTRVFNKEKCTRTLRCRQKSGVLANTVCIYPLVY